MVRFSDESKKFCSICDFDWPACSRDQMEEALLNDFCYEAHIEGKKVDELTMDSVMIGKVVYEREGDYYFTDRIVKSQ